MAFDREAFQFELSRWTDRFSRPVYFGSQHENAYDLNVNSGTGCLLRLDGRYFGVTCHHVLAAYRERKANEEVEFFYFGEAPIDPEALLIDESERLDLVTFDLSSVIGFSDRLMPVNFYEPRVWPPGDVAEQDIISFVGFPGEWRQQAGRFDLEFASFSHSATYIESVGEEHLCAHVALEESTFLIRTRETTGFAGGLSGSPVFVLRNSQILTVELVGFIYEYQPTFDLLYIRRAKCVNVDGKLLK
jgi:hypothetical protein